VKRRERLMLGLRLDEPVALADVSGAVDGAALARMERLGLAERRGAALVLTRRGRFLGGGVTAELLAERPAKSTIS
jgi:coproporphyrinogen III oxidase-like Fe-S oxidoreductase